MDEQPVFLRRARGYVPSPIFTEENCRQDIFTAGADLKNTFCFAKQNQFICSEHIGDLEDAEVYHHYLNSIEHLRKLFEVEPKVVACDLHPSYLSTQYALSLTGSKVISITVEYSSVASKSDEVLIIRPATDTVLALGMANVIIQEKLYDTEYVKSRTDLTLLVRMDTLKLVRAEDVIPGFTAPDERRDTKVIKKGQKAPAPIKAAGAQCISEDLLDEWGNFVVWDKNTNALVAVNGLRSVR